jgi:porphobilinogen synthase
MPGVARYPVERVGALAKAIYADGVRSVLLFGVAHRKDAQGSEAWSPKGSVPEAIRAIKRAEPRLVVATDVCLCAYTSHGHCGVVRNRSVDNDATVPLLGRVAAAHAAAGADIVAPSAAMDGQVATIRGALDANGHTDTAILGYSVKHASAFYGPFRDAEGSAPTFGDRRGYQMDYRNAREALRELEADVAEGADLVMVKPAMTNLDLLARARPLLHLPLGAYQVSGEYAMIKAAAARGVLEERAAVDETLAALRRAGADFVVTYFARDVARASGAGA